MVRVTLKMPLKQERYIEYKTLYNSVILKLLSLHVLLLFRHRKIYDISNENH